MILGVPANRRVLQACQHRLDRRTAPPRSCRVPRLALASVRFTSCEARDCDGYPRSTKTEMAMMTATAKAAEIDASVGLRRHHRQVCSNVVTGCVRASARPSGNAVNPQRDPPRSSNDDLCLFGDT